LRTNSGTAALFGCIGDDCAWVSKTVHLRRLPHSSETIDDRQAAFYSPRIRS
jgi:hypothetical protein